MTTTRLAVSIGCAALLVTGSLAAQQLSTAAIPAAVQRSLVARFPDVRVAAWQAGKGGNLVGEFRRGAVTTRATFKPSGEWVQTASEIGAITLPEPIRTAIVSRYRGYSFAQTMRIDRAEAAAPQFEVLLEKASEKLTLRFAGDGALVSSNSEAPPPEPPIVLAGTWRGESICAESGTTCVNEAVVFRIAQVPGDTTGFDIHGTKLVAGAEVPMGDLACTLDRLHAAVYCLMEQGKWQFEARHDSLIGGLKLTNGTMIRRVAVRRDH